MGYPLKTASTAQPLVFLMIDGTDHLAGKTGLSPTVTLSKAGGSFASPSGAVTEIGSGWYKVAGNATDTGTLGPLILHATGTGADPTDDRFDVVAYDPQSATNLGLSFLDASISGSVATLVPISAVASSGTLTTGTSISGTYAATASDDNTRHSVAPVNPGGLVSQLTFHLGAGRVPTSLSINGHFNGSGSGANVDVLNSVTGAWDRLSNSATWMGTRANDLDYVYLLSRQHADASGDVAVRWVSTSTNTAHRLNIDRALCYHITETSSAAAVTAADIWSYGARSLTSSVPGEEPVEPASVAQIAAGVRAELTAELAHVDADVSSLATASALAAVAADVDAGVAAIRLKTDDLPAAWPAHFGSMAIATTGLVSVDFAQTGLVVREMSGVADADVTLGDCLLGGLQAGAGEESVVGTAYVKKTPAGTTFRTFALDAAAAPTSRS